MSVARFASLCGLVVMIGGFYLPASGSSNLWNGLASGDQLVLGLGVAAFVAAAMRPPWLRLPDPLPHWTMAAALALIGGVLAIVVAGVIADADGIGGLAVVGVGSLAALAGSIVDLVTEIRENPQRGGAMAGVGPADPEQPARSAVDTELVEADSTRESDPDEVRERSGGADTAVAMTEAPSQGSVAGESQSQVDPPDGPDGPADPFSLPG